MRAQFTLDGGMMHMQAWLPIGLLARIGALFMLLGFAAALTPPAYGNAWLGVGFGALQLTGGIYIARHHGG